MAENVGDILTYQILTEDTRQVINRSVIRSALDPDNINYRAEFPEEPSAPRDPFVLSSSDIAVPGLDPFELNLPKLSPDELVGHTFLHETEDGQRVHAEVIRKLATLDAANHQHLKFIVKVGDVEDVMGYVELCDTVEQQIQEEQADPDKYWTYKGIIDHQGPLTSASEDWKGSTYNQNMGAIERLC